MNFDRIQGFFAGIQVGMTHLLFYASGERIMRLWAKKDTFEDEYSEFFGEYSFPFLYFFVNVHKDEFSTGKRKIFPRFGCFAVENHVETVENLDLSGSVFHYSTWEAVENSCQAFSERKFKIC